MGAARNILPIECYCNETQMSGIVKAVSSHMDVNDRRDISDFDSDFGCVRVIVEFEIYLDKISLKDVAILDHEREVLPEDTAVLESRLTTIVNSYNRRDAELRRQGLEVLSDQTL